MPVEEAISKAKEFGAAFSADEVCTSDLVTGTHERMNILFIELDRILDRTLLLHVQAQALISALHMSGDVLRHENKLYLKPEEVAEIVLQALPDTQEEAQACSPRWWHLPHAFSCS